MALVYLRGGGQGAGYYDEITGRFYGTDLKKANQLIGLEAAGFTQQEAAIVAQEQALKDKIASGQTSKTDSFQLEQFTAQREQKRLAAAKKAAAEEAERQFRARIKAAGLEGNQELNTAIDKADTRRIEELLRVAEFGLKNPDLPVDPKLKELIEKSVGGAEIDKTNLSEFASSQRQLATQKQQLLDFRNKTEQQLFGALGGSVEDALSSPSGEFGQLANALRQQQSDIFRTELSPLINQNLANQGLFDSGANVELQSEALGGLERQRQSTLLQAALGGKEHIRNLERADILGDIGGQQAALSNSFELQRQNLTMEFQRQLENERNNLARELAQRQGGGSNLGKILGSIGGAALGGLGAYLSGPAGATGSQLIGRAGFGAGLGAQFGGQFGGFFDR